MWDPNLIDLVVLLQEVEETWDLSLSLSLAFSAERKGHVRTQMMAMCMPRGEGLLKLHPDVNFILDL